jgi:hypothetical protein
MKKKKTVERNDIEYLLSNVEAGDQKEELKIAEELYQ